MNSHTICAMTSTRINGHMSSYLPFIEWYIPCKVVWIDPEAGDCYTTHCVTDDTKTYRYYDNIMVKYQHLLVTDYRLYFISHGSVMTPTRNLGWAVDTNAM